VQPPPHFCSPLRAVHTVLQKNVRTLYKVEGAPLMRNCNLEPNQAHQFTIK